MQTRALVSMAIMPTSKICIASQMAGRDLVHHSSVSWSSR